ncbi:MAG: uroporphyrinogen-III synthase [Bacteroidetes bacterium]|nr:uroporphyrinogen-III synthase [Bacteroidota bacterium]
MSDPDIRVLSTRPLPAALIESARAKGIAIDVIPFIATSTTVDEQLLHALKQRRMTVVFTSANAVEAVGAAKDWSIFCLSGATRRAAAGNFGEETIVDVADSAAQLAQKIIEHGVRSVCFFCGDLRREELPSILRQAGVGCREVVVYKTIATPQKTGVDYKGILFFSPSAVESYLSVNTVPEAATLFAIGNTSAGALKRYDVVVSDRPEAAALVEKVIEHFQNKI